MPSLDEPLPSVQVQSDNVECVVSQECVVSEAPSAEASLSDVLYVTSGDRFEQLASSLVSQMRELQSDGGVTPQYRVIPLWVVVVSLLLPLLII